MYSEPLFLGTLVVLSVVIVSIVGFLFFEKNSK